MTRPDFDPVSLLGRAVGDDAVAAYLRFHDETCPIDVFTLAGPAESYGAGLNGFVLSADVVSVYEQEVGQPVSRVTNESGEMIVRRICLSDSDCAVPGSKAYPHPLPLGLQFGDPAEVVTRKLGAKPQHKMPSGLLPDYSPVRFNWIFRRGDLVVQVGLTQNLALAAVGLRARESWERPAQKASRKAESAAIDPAKAAAVEALRATFPTARWRETLADGDELFTEPIIAKAEALLDRYIDDVKAATAQKSAPKIRAATKRLVVALNKLNAAAGWIETLERDELGELIDKVVKASGLHLADGEDITMPLREW